MTNYLSQLDPVRKSECEVIVKIMQKITKEEPRMWGASMVGFGQYHYTYESGREGEWFICGFSPRKANLTLYLMSGFDNHEELLSKLGKYTTGKSCLYIKRLSDVDLDVLKKLIAGSVTFMNKI